MVSRGLFSILLTVFFLAFGMSFVAPLIPLMIKGIGASSATIGQIQTTYFLFFTLTTCFLGRFIERMGSKKMILTGLFIFGCAIIAMPYTPTPSLFYILRMFQGIGSALLFAPTEAAINIISPPEKRATNMGLYGVVFAVGFAIGPAIGTTLYTIDVSAPFMFGGMFCFFSMIVLIIGFNETPVPIKTTEWGFFQFVNFLKIPLTAAACYAVVEVSIGSFLSLYIDHLGIGGTALGFVFTIFAIGGVISPFPAGKLADKLGKIPVLKFCGLLLAVVTLSFSFFREYWMVCFLIFWVGIVAGALYPISLALIGDIVPPEKMGTANAAFSFAYGIGCIGGPLVTGWVIELFTIKYLFYPMTISSFLFVLVTAFGTANMIRNQNSTT